MSLENDSDGDGECDDTDNCTDLTACNYDDNAICHVSTQMSVACVEATALLTEPAIATTLKTHSAFAVIAPLTSMDSICDDEDDCVEQSMSVAFATVQAFQKENAYEGNVLDAAGDCGGDCFAADSTGACIEVIMFGCLDSLACNFRCWPTRTADCAIAWRRV